jgi:neutral amino acid transport system ATP-binding protein
VNNEESAPSAPNSAEGPPSAPNSAEGRPAAPNSAEGPPSAPNSADGSSAVPRAAERPRPGALDTSILQVDDLVRSFGGIHAVDGATFEVKRSSITALIGPNGAGKTTLFNVITGFYRGERGAVTFEHASIFGRPPYVIARRGMVRTFQITKALARMPVLDNMMLAAPSQPGEKLRNVIFRAPAAWRREREIRERALELLGVFDLERLANDYAGTLSGGQRKLLELARALMTEPRLLLLDEPMAGINPTLGRRLLDHMHRLRDEQGVTFLFIEHDMDIVMEHAENVIVMADGRVIASGPPEEIRRDQRVIDAYLGSGPAEPNGAG